MKNSAIAKLCRWLPVLLLLAGFSVQAQPPAPKKPETVSFRAKKVAAEFPFVRQKQNKLFVPDSLAMRHFYRALDSLRNGKRQKVNVVHIGDSHIQADIFSGKVRQLLQADSAFGNGGRGLIFPYPLARTNNPWNYKVSYTGTWSGCRNIQASRDCPWGLTGITAETTEPGATFSVQNNSVSATGFNKVRVFYPVQDPTSFKVQLLADSLVYEPMRIDTAGFVVFGLPEEVGQVTVQLQKTSPLQERFVLQGISLENDRPGLQYSALGINGAEVVSFLRSPFLEPNLKALQPDLIIISLGTNDAYGKNFDPKVFFQNYGTLLQRLQRAAPRASVLLTTPGDCYRFGKYPNLNNGLAGSEMKELAEQTNTALWDFYHVMGGFRSVVLWQQNGLAAKDKVHLTGKGYRLQGELLFDALMRGYEEWRR